MPIGWESHSSPQMGLRPQEVINRQILKDCDLSIAAFWTRIGSPTGEFASGTVEEIEEHLSAGKPAMLYFSTAPVQPDSIDKKQYKELQKFKKSCESRGLIESYDSLSVFKGKISRHLAQTVIRNFTTDTVSQKDLATQQLEIPPLSEYAKFLLQEVAQDSEGTLLKLFTFNGLHIQTNGKEHNPETSRDRAEMESAVNQLQLYQLIQDRGHKGEVFAMVVVHEGMLG